MWTFDPVYSAVISQLLETSFDQNDVKAVFKVMRAGKKIEEIYCFPWINAEAEPMNCIYSYKFQDEIHCFH